MRITLKDLFAVSGRANRLVYWKTVLSAWALFVVLLALGIFLRSEAVDVIILVACLPLAAISVCVTIRRLHDRDRSAWWLLPFVILPSLLNAAAKFLQGQNALGPSVILSLAVAVLGIWGFVEIGCLKGMDGPNRFGPDPLVPDENPDAFT